MTDSNRTSNPRNDLVQRLRALANEWYECCGDIHVPLRDAADELERLQEQSKYWEGLWKQAANGVLGLQADVEELTRERDTNAEQTVHMARLLLKCEAERDRLRAERDELLRGVNEDEGYERLRAALDKIANKADPKGEWEGHSPEYNVLMDVGDIARNALEGIKAKHAAEGMSGDNHSGRDTPGGHSNIPKLGAIAPKLGAADETTVRCPVIVGLDTDRRRCTRPADHDGNCEFR